MTTPLPWDAPGAVLPPMALMQQTRSSLEQLLQAYAALGAHHGETLGEKQAIVERLTLELTLSTQVEEEVLMPALQALGQDLSPFAAAHDCAWSLVAHLSMGDPGEPRFDSRLVWMGEELMQHLQRLHDGRLAPVLAALKDPSALALGMQARSRELWAACGEGVDEDESEDPVGGTR